MRRGPSRVNCSSRSPNGPCMAAQVEIHMHHRHGRRTHGHVMVTCMAMHGPLDDHCFLGGCPLHSTSMVIPSVTSARRSQAIDLDLYVSWRLFRSQARMASRIQKHPPPKHAQAMPRCCFLNKEEYAARSTVALGQRRGRTQTPVPSVPSWSFRRGFIRTVWRGRARGGRGDDGLPEVLPGAFE